MSARVQWTILSNYSAGSHPPVVSVNSSCGSEHIEFKVNPEQTVTLDGSATYDPDAGLPGHGDLEYKWWQYKEVSSTMGISAASIPTLNLTTSQGGRVVELKLPSAVLACPPVDAAQNKGLGVQKSCLEYHVILEVKGSGTPPIRRYKRVILKVQSPLAHS